MDPSASSGVVLSVVEFDGLPRRNQGRVPAKWLYMCVEW